jgi:hypothetical protein
LAASHNTFNHSLPLRTAFGEGCCRFHYCGFRGCAWPRHSRRGKHKPQGPSSLDRESDSVTCALAHVYAASVSVVVRLCPARQTVCDRASYRPPRACGLRGLTQGSEELSESLRSEWLASRHSDGSSDLAAASPQPSAIQIRGLHILNTYTKQQVKSLTTLLHMCVCVLVCNRAREGEPESERGARC